MMAPTKPSEPSVDDRGARRGEHGAEIQRQGHWRHHQIDPRRDRGSRDEIAQVERYFDRVALPSDQDVGQRRTQRRTGPSDGSAVTAAMMTTTDNENERVCSRAS